MVPPACTHMGPCGQLIVLLYCEGGRQAVCQIVHAMQVGARSWVWLIRVFTKASLRAIPIIHVKQLDGEEMLHELYDAPTMFRWKHVALGWVLYILCWSCYEYSGTLIMILRWACLPCNFPVSSGIKGQQLQAIQHRTSSDPT